MNALLSCEICEQRFTDDSGPYVPLAISCGHTYCRSCLQQWEAKERDVCPKCRKPFVGGVESLPHNFTLIQLISSGAGKALGDLSVEELQAELNKKRGVEGHQKNFLHGFTADELQVAADHKRAEESRVRELEQAEDEYNWQLEIVSALSTQFEKFTTQLEAKIEAEATATTECNAEIDRLISEIKLKVRTQWESALEVKRSEVQQASDQLEKTIGQLEMANITLHVLEARVRELGGVGVAGVTGVSALADSRQRRPSTPPLHHHRTYTDAELESIRIKTPYPGGLHSKSTGELLLDATEAGDLAAMVPLVHAWAGNSTVLNCRDVDGWTALMLASCRGFLGAVQLLVATPGVDLNVRDSFIGNTALILASDNARTQVVECLLSRPDLDIDAVTMDGRTALLCSKNEAIRCAILLASACQPGQPQTKTKSAGRKKA